MKAEPTMMVDDVKSRLETIQASDSYLPFHHGCVRNLFNRRRTNGPNEMDELFHGGLLHHLFLLQAFSP